MHRDSHSSPVQHVNKLHNKIISCRSSLLSGRNLMYDGRVECCPLASHGEYADGTDGQTDARPLHYAFDYRRGQRNKCSARTVYRVRHSATLKPMTHWPVCGIPDNWCHKPVGYKRASFFLNVNPPKIVDFIRLYSIYTLEQRRNDPAAKLRDLCAPYRQVLWLVEKRQVGALPWRVKREGIMNDIAYVTGTCYKPLVLDLQCRPSLTYGSVHTSKNASSTLSKESFDL